MVKRSRILLVVVLLLLPALFSCRSLTEEEQLRALQEAGTPQARVEQAREFLLRFPQSEDRREAARIWFQSALELEDGAAAEESARAFLDATEENRRDSLRGSLARSLAEEKLSLDFAETLARDAVEKARAGQSGSLAGLLDTLAYVLYRNGKLEEARQLQAEAVELQPGREDLLASLALYQFESGDQSAGIENGVRALLLGDEDLLYRRFPDWIRAVGPETGEQLTVPLVDGYLQEGDSPGRKGRAALVLALAGLQLDRAESLARSAIDTLEKAGPDSAEAAADVRVDLAFVLIAQERYREAIDMLAAQESGRSPWEMTYWYALGRAYRLSEQPEKAKTALLQPLVILDSAAVRSELAALAASDDQVEEWIDREKQRLESFDPGTFAGSIPGTGRIPLVELFTGAECNPCQSADMAMDLVGEYYPKQSVAILEHHVHIPQPDPMTTGATDLRYQYYGTGGTPTVWVDGVERIGGGGPPILKESRFRQYAEAIERRWGVRPKVELSLSAGLAGDLVNVSVQAQSPGGESPSGTVRIALVEKSVDYEGGNGIKHHAFVVRHLSDPNAPVVQLDGGSAKVEYQIDLVQVEEDHARYLADFEANPPERYQGFAGFRSKPIRIDRSDLAVVAWVENRETREVLQSSAAEL